MLMWCTQLYTQKLSRVCYNYTLRKRKACCRLDVCRSANRPPTTKKHGVPNEVRLSCVGVHLPEVIPKFLRCRFCSSRTVNKRWRVQCSMWKVALYTDCFQTFHKWTLTLNTVELCKLRIVSICVKCYARVMLANNRVWGSVYIYKLFWLNCSRRAVAIFLYIEFTPGGQWQHICHAKSFTEFSQSAFRAIYQSVM